MSVWLTLVIMLAANPALSADEFELTPDAPVDQFQNLNETSRPYDFDAPPKGMFLSIALAEGYDEEFGFRRTHEVVPINPTEQFVPDAPAVYIVFHLHQHYQAFTVFGLCFADQEGGTADHRLVTRDEMYITMEDESGYLRLPAPEGGWQQGRYKVEIHVGEQISELSLMGTMRFTVAAHRPNAPHHSGL